MTNKRRYWLALHPDIRKPIGGAKQMHRFAEALMHCGREATNQGRLTSTQAGLKVK